MYVRGFTKFSIKVLWRLQFLEYLRTLSLKFQKTRTKIKVVLSVPCRLSQFSCMNVEGVSKVSRLTNCRFTTISSQISAIYINIFHKTEVQTVILRCWTGLYLNWCKSYDKNEKHTKNTKKPKITINSTRILFLLQPIEV